MKYDLFRILILILFFPPRCDLVSFIMLNTFRMHFFFDIPAKFVYFFVFYVYSLLFRSIIFQNIPTYFRLFPFR